MIPKQGSLSWPGRASLDHRERILVEAKTIQELFEATGTVPGDLDAALGWLEYLVDDWNKLRDPEYKIARGNESIHKIMIRESEHYRKAINWQGDIPRHQRDRTIIPSWYSLRN